MGTSTRYSSATDKPMIPTPMPSDVADASGGRAIPVTDTTPELLLALARVEQSLKTVLTHIAAIQREMGITTPPTPDVPLRPDDSWIGTP